MGFLAPGKRAYNQTSNNCFEIACCLARKFGFRPPSSKRELTDMLLERRAQDLGWGVVGEVSKSSPAALVIRTTDVNVKDVHVAFELYGREYNYGPGAREGFPIEKRIPLYK